MAGPERRRGLAATAALVTGSWALLTGVLLLCGQGVVASSAVTTADRVVTAWVVARRTPALDTAMRAFTWSGTWFAALALVVVLVVLTVAGRIGPLVVATVAVGWLGEIAAVNLTKAVVQRPRPPEAVRLVPVHGWAFPSGHTANAVVVFATATALTFLLVVRPAARVLVSGVGAAVVALVAFSRVELGAHWLSDVVASVVWTTAWLLVAATVLAGCRLPGSGAAGSGAGEEHRQANPRAPGRHRQPLGTGEG